MKFVVAVAKAYMIVDYPNLMSTLMVIMSTFLQKGILCKVNVGNFCTSAARTAIILEPPRSFHCGL